MKPIDALALHLDQDQCLTLIAKLKLHASRLHAIAQDKGKSVQSPTLSHGTESDPFADINALVDHINDCEALIGNGEFPEFDFAVAPHRDCEQRCAARSGGSAAANRTDFSASRTAKSSAKKPNMTEQVLAARGVKSLDELNAKCHAERQLQPHKLGD